MWYPSRSLTRVLLARSMHTTEYHTHISVSGRAKESPTFFFTASRTLSDLAVLVINEEVRWTSNE